MTPHLLANEFCQQQLMRPFTVALLSNLGYPNEVVHNLSDEKVIDCLNTCSCRGDKILTPRLLESAIARSETLLDFVRIREELRPRIWHEPACNLSSSKEFLPELRDVLLQTGMEKRIGSCFVNMQMRHDVCVAELTTVLATCVLDWFSEEVAKRYGQRPAPDSVVIILSGESTADVFRVELQNRDGERIVGLSLVEDDELLFEVDDCDSENWGAVELHSGEADCRAEGALYLVFDLFEDQLIRATEE